MRFEWDGTDKQVLRIIPETAADGAELGRTFGACPPGDPNVGLVGGRGPEARVVVYKRPSYCKCPALKTGDF